jgi:hypothetical protein
MTVPGPAALRHAVRPHAHVGAAAPPSRRTSGGAAQQGRSARSAPTSAPSPGVFGDVLGEKLLEGTGNDHIGLFGEP